MPDFSSLGLEPWMQAALAVVLGVVLLLILWVALDGRRWAKEDRVRAQRATEERPFDAAQPTMGQPEHSELLARIEALEARLPPEPAPEAEALRQELADSQELLVRMSADRQDLVAKVALLEAQLATAARELETAKRALAMAPTTSPAETQALAEALADSVSPAETQALAEALADSVAAQKRLQAERDALASQVGASAMGTEEFRAAQSLAERRAAEAEDNAARLQEQMEAVRQDRDRTRAELAALQAAVGRERDEAAMLRAELERRSAAPEAMVEVAEALVGRDPLESIPGLGAAARRALRAGGIRSYADLARATTERIRQLVGPGEPGQPDPAALILAAAELLARERS